MVKKLSQKKEFIKIKQIKELIYKLRNENNL